MSIDADLRRRLQSQRLRSQLLSSPASSPLTVVKRLLALQSQDFWGGRWAIAARCSRSETLSSIDARFGRRGLVRSWTMRGTLHTVRAADLGWMLAVTGERQFAQLSRQFGELSITDRELDSAADLARQALVGTRELTRSGLTAVLEGGGLDCSGKRGTFRLQALALRGVLALGPVVPRAEGITQEQYLVAMDDCARPREPVEDPLAELFIRYVIGHGPVTVEDFAFWAGLPVTWARRAAETPDPRIRRTDDDGATRYRAERLPPPGDGPDVHALPTYDEYFLGARDRSIVCTPERERLIGPLKNGIVQPLIVVDGEVVGTWRHQRSVPGLKQEPTVELFPGAERSVRETAIQEALDRYWRFIRTAT